MSNYVRSVDFAGKDALISGNPAKAVKGVDLGIEFDAIAAMSATKLDASASANPTGTIGLTANNGTAPTFFRSDATAALSQAIVPTWTGVHTFSALPVFNAGVTINAATRNVASFAQTALVFGNTTDNPTYTFTGSGVTTFTGFIDAKGDTVGAFRVRNTAGVQAGQISTVNAWVGSGSTTDLAIGSAGTNLSFYTNNLSRLSASFAPTALTFGNTTDNQTASFVGSGGLKFGDEGAVQQHVGFRGVPQNQQLGNYTTVMADRGKHILHNSGAPHTFTIDSNANVAYEIGSTISFINIVGGGTLTIAITSDTLTLAGAGTTGSRTLAANGLATAVKITATAWMISGSGLT